MAMDGSNVANGNIDLTIPKTSAQHGLALTEYSANCAPGGEHPAPKSVVPSALLMENGYPDYLRLIMNSRVYDVVKTTPLEKAVNLSNRLESNVLLKREDLQPVFSFKLRGAYNKMAHLDPAERWKGVVACSAGNHAQGVAYSARKLKIPATIVMPKGTPAIKHMNVSRLGASVVLHGDDFDAAKAEAQRLQKAHGLVSIPPFDDPYVIAGQGTIATEIMTQTSLPDLEAIFCCVGGGGLISGIGVLIKRLVPHVKIIGVETYDANAMAQSLDKGRKVILDEVGLFADGAAVKAVGDETFRLCQEVVDEIIQVDTDETCAAIKDVFDDTRSIVEPAGALALAGLKKYVARNPSTNTKRGLIAIASGAGMNFDRLRFVAERAALGEKKEAILFVTIPEEPRAFSKLINTVLPRAVTEFSYRYGNAKSAGIIMGISVNASTREADLADLTKQLEVDGMTCDDISDDEFAKSHMRYLNGGRSDVADERLYMFEFPERPGALFRFLNAVRPDRNISLFHYRNNGGDVGKITAGIQCPEDERAELDSFLKKLGYPFTEITDHPLYRSLLRH